MPSTTAEYFTTFLVDEETDFGFAGYLTIDGLSFTVQSVDTVNTSNTFETTSYEATAQGQAMFTYKTVANSSKIAPESMGQNETFVQMLPPGAYERGGTYFTTTGGLSTFTAGDQSMAAMFPVRFIAPDTVADGADLVTWTESRNSHPAMTGLTAAAAYMTP